MEQRLLDKLSLELQRFREKDFLKAAMAAAALVAYADGAPRPVERQALEQAMNSLPALTQLDRVKAQRLFAEYGDALEGGQRHARQVLYRKVGRYAGQLKPARTLLRVAYLIIMADGRDHPDELREFKRLCGLLALDPSTVWGELAAAPR